MKNALLVGVACLGLAACAEGHQRGVESRTLDSGVTSSTGGGQDYLKNNPNVGLQPGAGVTQRGGAGRNPVTNPNP
ncbi:MAG: hypothetical protein JOZ42_15950 [Acetobacteraceae bacterium]|nr:hypothetical protein [Acetobacteraceae bacterium]